MEKDSPTSFIPKQVMTERRPTHQPVGLFFLITLVVALISLLFWGGAWWYENYLEQEIKRKCPDENSDSLVGCGLEAALDKIKRSLDAELIQHFERLDNQLKAADKILAEHISGVPVFDWLERETLQTVRYDSFDFTSDHEMTLRGAARSYESIALQSIVFAADPSVIDFVFSGLNTDSKNNITFNLEMTLDPSLTLYRTHLVELPPQS